VHGDTTIDWAADDGMFYYCKPPSIDCAMLDAWPTSNPPLAPGDSQPTFLVAIAALDAEPGMVLTNSNLHVWKADSTPTWTDLGSFAPHSVVGVAGSARTAGLYGAALDDSAAVTSDGGVHWTVSAPLGVDGHVLGYTSSVALPPVPPSGTQSGDTYLAASIADGLGDGTPVPREINHLFVTHDRGSTWQPLGGAQLPNVPVLAVRYDPSDATARTIYVATAIGMYASSDGGASWARLGTGLPMASVSDFEVARDGSFMRVATWGRGIWELGLNHDNGDGGGTAGTAAGCGGCDAGGSPGSACVLAALVGVALRRRAGRNRRTAHRYDQPRAVARVRPSLAVVVGSLTASCVAHHRPTSNSVDADTTSTRAISLGALIHDPTPPVNGAAPDLAAMGNYATMVGAKPAIILSFIDWTVDFPMSSLDKVVAFGATPLLTWQACAGDCTARTPTAYTDKNIAAGMFDAYLTEFANAAKAWGKPFFLRLMHEMNGGWYTWGTAPGNINGNTPAD
jgi:hypothetical protein